MEDYIEKKWSDWILENQRRSAEIFPALSSLVQVVEKHSGRRRKQERYQYCTTAQSKLLPLHSNGIDCCLSLSLY